MKKKRWVAFLWMLMGLSACSSLNQKQLHVEESKNINKTEPMPSDPPSTELVDPNLSSDLDSQPVDEGQEELLPRSKQVRLAIPFCMQETGYYCAVACLQMVLEYHGISMTQEELAARLHTDPITGTEYEDLAREASILIFGKVPASDAESGYRAVLWKQNEGTDSMKQDLQRRIMMDLESGDPVFLSINMKVAYGSQNDLVHEVVLYGADYDDSGEPIMYYFMDPSSSQQDLQYGGRKKFTPDELWNMMNDNPEPGYVW